MKRRNIILLISIPLGIMLIVYYGYTALDTWIQFQIITGNGILVANSGLDRSYQSYVYTEF